MDTPAERSMQLMQDQESGQDWSNWWDPQQAATVISPDMLDGATIVACSNTGTSVPYASDYGEDWFADQLRNIPMLLGNGEERNEIIQVDENAANGNGYVLVADRELAAILGGHVDRDTIYWLLANFKLERNAVMPRGFLYSKYDVFCALHGKPLMNQACMGKTVRALFRGLETRRLGRRGKSRYHYIGLAINPDGEFAGMVPLEPEEPAPEPGDGERKRRRTTMASKKLQENPIAKHFQTLDSDGRLGAALDQLEKMLDSRHSRVLMPVRLRKEPSLPFDDGTIPEGLTRDDIYLILRDFKIHLLLLGHAIVSGVILALPSILQNFWSNHIPSLQIPEEFDRAKMALSLTWRPFVEYIGMGFVDLYGLILEQLIPRTDKPLNPQTLDFLYEFAGKYPQWVRAAAAHLDIDVQAVLAGAAISFCQILKQMSVLNSALGLVDLIERDRAKAGVVSDGFRALSDRLVLISNTTNTPDQVVLGVQTVELMDFIADYDYTLQRWRGWIRCIVDAKLLEIATSAANNISIEDLCYRKEIALEEIRMVTLGLLLEMQKQVERSGKDYATPMTYVLSYYMHYTIYALDHMKAHLQEYSLIQFAYKTARTALLEGDSLDKQPSPNYEINFFSQRLINTLNINVFDFQYFGKFEELRPLIHLPQFAAESALNFRGSSSVNGDSSVSDFTANERILSEYLQQGPSSQLNFDASSSYPAETFELLEVQTDAVVPDNDILLQVHIEGNPGV